jgi:hypothetical protein
MNTSRETIYQTIFETLQKAVVDPLNFKTASRRAIPWTQVDAQSGQPALFQTQVKELATVQGRGIPTKWDLDIDIMIYVNGGSSLDVIPSQILNPAIDIIEGLFPGVGPTYQTLGLPGVQEIRIQGEIVYNEGLLGAQAVAVIPIHVVAV